MAGAGASSSSENTRTGHPSARQVGTTALLILVLVLLGHGWALHGVAGLMRQLSDPPQPASQISSPLLTRTIVKAAPTPTPQPPQPLAAPARSPPPAPPPLCRLPLRATARLSCLRPIRGILRLTFRSPRPYPPTRLHAPCRRRRASIGCSAPPVAQLTLVRSHLC